MSQIACPACGTEVPLALLFRDQESHQAFARLAAVSIPLGARVLGYVTLFTPPKTRLTLPKQVHLISQLLPDLERQAITHKGRDWSAPLSAWAAAFDQMALAKTAGRLELPMKGHSYLYTILAGMADKTEAAQEAQDERDRRNTPRRDSVQVNGQSMVIGDALQVTYAGMDPALAAAKQRSREATPMPQEVRERLAQLKGGKA